MSTKHKPVVEKKYYVIAKALKLTNGSPIAQQIVHDLYNKGYLVDPNATPQAGDGADILTELDYGRIS